MSYIQNALSPPELGNFIKGVGATDYTPIPFTAADFALFECNPRIAATESHLATVTKMLEKILKQQLMARIEMSPMTRVHPVYAERTPPMHPYEGVITTHYLDMVLPRSYVSDIWKKHAPAITLHERHIHHSLEPVIANAIERIAIQTTYWQKLLHGQPLLQGDIVDLSNIIMMGHQNLQPMTGNQVKLDSSTSLSTPTHAMGLEPTVFIMLGETEFWSPNVKKQMSSSPIWPAYYALQTTAFNPRAVLLHLEARQASSAGLKKARKILDPDFRNRILPIWQHLSVAVNIQSGIVTKKSMTVFGRHKAN
ncbi:hypothetical protein CPB83DRAFT_841173 [Crepidotus variabilis]|uniref:Uncharacterized protein n=1 Tax=Crepidotus variabilis TaxID=179855 RepID=A0A9P6JHM9_9AGAR|nr:hypothetical protein CPB83DRAFT_841173 [Crepidotus variabilis]